ncbi:MAG TPA: serine hydrolase [Longimicrobiales bacterium]|nr:serine hydrolase [Longimicrobiales bacterium]
MRRILTCLVFLLAVPSTGLAGVKASLREVADPRAAGMDAAGLRKVDALINAAIRRQVTPGAALAIGRNGKVVRLRGYGRTDYGSAAARVDEHTLYDLASLTKAVGTTSAVMLLVQQGRLDLDAPLGDYLMEWRAALDRQQLTARHLLSHTSGLPPGGSLGGVGRDRSLVPAFMAGIRLTAPPGVRYEYSDYGMILLGAVVERITGERLDAFLDRHLFQPAGLRETGFVPLPMEPDEAVSAFRLTASRRALISRIAPTERTVSRGHIRGVVHDPLAYRLHGVAGHAGMFSSAHDLALFAQLLLEEGVQDSTRIFDSSVLRAFTGRPSRDARFALGWELGREGGPSGTLFPSSSFGHTGFTGTSIWIDPEHSLYVVLLTNRVSPNASEKRHAKLRRDVHDAVQRALLPG